MSNPNKIDPFNPDADPTPQPDQPSPQVPGGPIDVPGTTETPGHIDLPQDPAPQPPSVPLPQPIHLPGDEGF